jgi:hypothetical protein
VGSIPGRESSLKTPMTELHRTIIHATKVSNNRRIIERATNMDLKGFLIDAD